VEKRLRRAAVAEHDRLLRLEPCEHRRVSRRALDPAVAEDERVHGRRVRVDELRDRELMRRGDVRPCETRRGESAHRFLEALRRHVEGNVGPVERKRGERRVLHPRRERVADRVTEQRDELRRCCDHPP
jgi:hypothetical protein